MALGGTQIRLLDSLVLLSSLCTHSSVSFSSISLPLGHPSGAQSLGVWGPLRNGLRSAIPCPCHVAPGSCFWRGFEISFERMKGWASSDMQILE